MCVWVFFFFTELEHGLTVACTGQLYQTIMDVNVFMCTGPQRQITANGDNQI